METEHASDSTSTSARRQAAIDRFKQAREDAMGAYKRTVDEAWRECCDVVGLAGDDLMAELLAADDDPPAYHPDEATPLVTRDEVTAEADQNDDEEDEALS